MKGNPKNIRPTPERIERARRGLKRALQAGKINQAQYDGLLKGLNKRAKAI